MKNSASSLRLNIPFILVLVLSLFLCQARRTESHDKTISTQTADKPVQLAEGGQVSKIYQFKAKALDGREIDFKNYEGDVLLIVNTASKCGFTPQYAGLEELNKKYGKQGLKILGFPCNQFGGQEPGDPEQISDFCHKNYGVDFQMFDKIDVNGKNAHPLYKYLTETAPGLLGSKDIKWNFTKFLIDRKGKVVERFAPNVKPEDIDSAIEKLL